MAENVTLTGTRNINGVDKEVTYIASVQGDGYCYFNDDFMFRCLKDGSSLQLFYFNKNIWIDTGIIQNLQVVTFDLIAIIQKILSLLNGGGSSAPSGSVEAAVQWAIDTANDESHGYDWGNRWGPDYDCSSLVITAFESFGVKNAGATYTGNMRQAFVNCGFEWIPGLGNNGASELQRGDILLNESNHVEIYIGEGRMVGAHINEFGDVYGGQTGDQTGQEISVGNWYSYPWDGVLRYHVEGITIPATVPQTGIIGDYTGYAGISWASGTNQRRLFDLWRNAGSPYSNRIATYNNRYLIAMTPKFGVVGDNVEVNLDDGTVIFATLADIKGGDAGSEWGHYFGNAISLVEFEAQSGFATSDVPSEWRYKKVTSVVNTGSIF